VRPAYWGSAGSWGTGVGQVRDAGGAEGVGHCVDDVAGHSGAAYADVGAGHGVVGVAGQDSVGEVSHASAGEAAQGSVAGHWVAEGAGLDVGAGELGHAAGVGGDAGAGDVGHAEGGDAGGDAGAGDVGHAGGGDADVGDAGQAGCVVGGAETGWPQVPQYGVGVGSVEPQVGQVMGSSPGVVLE
jgi:hypothetical protein